MSFIFVPGIPRVPITQTSDFVYSRASVIGGDTNQAFDAYEYWSLFGQIKKHSAMSLLGFYSEFLGDPAVPSTEYNWTQFGNGYMVVGFGNDWRADDRVGMFGASVYPLFEPGPATGQANAQISFFPWISNSANSGAAGAMPTLADRFMVVNMTRIKTAPGTFEWGKIPLFLD